MYEYSRASSVGGEPEAGAENGAEAGA